MQEKAIAIATVSRLAMENAPCEISCIYDSRVTGYAVTTTSHDQWKLMSIIIIILSWTQGNCMKLIIMLITTNTCTHNSRNNIM